MGSLAVRLLLVSGVLLALLGPVVLAVLLGDGWLAAGAAETGGEVALLVALLAAGHGVTLPLLSRRATESGSAM